MRALEKALKKLEGKLLSIKRNTMTGNYELEVGLPKTWVYKSNDSVETEVIIESEDGVLLLVRPIEESGAVIDDLIDFVNVIITTNERIARKEEEFNKKMEEAKKLLEDQVAEFYEELEGLKEESFNSMEDAETPKKQTKTRKSATTSKTDKEAPTNQSEEELMSKLS